MNQDSTFFYNCFSTFKSNLFVYFDVENSYFKKKKANVLDGT